MDMNLEFILLDPLVRFTLINLALTLVAAISAWAWLFITKRRGG